MSSTPFLLERLGDLVHQSLREDAARHGLLPIHIQVLEYLSQANRYSDIPIAVSEYFGITRGTVSQTLALLERNGLLLKEPDARHGKRVHLRLTAAGRAILRDSWTRRLEAAFPSFASVDRNALDAALRKLLTTLQRQNNQRAFGICRQCTHFLSEARGSRCGLTGEPLAKDQTVRICREWTAPAPTGSAPQVA